MINFFFKLLFVRSIVNLWLLTEE